MAGESLSYQVYHIFPQAVIRDLGTDYSNIFTGNKTLGADDYSNSINLFDNSEMAAIMKSFYKRLN